MIKILIPAHNEQEGISDAVISYKEYGIVVVCDNASLDGTAQQAKKAGAKIIFEESRGKGHAVRRLLQEKADIYVLTDGDDAFYSEDCKKMIELIKQGKADMVIGKRIDINAHNKNSIFLRNIFLKLLKSLFRIKFGHVDDFMSGYRAFNNQVKKKLSLKSSGFDIETEMAIQALKNHFRILEIPVRVKPRKSGKQKSNIFNVGFPVLIRIISS